MFSSKGFMNQSIQFKVYIPYIPAFMKPCKFELERHLLALEGLQIVFSTGKTITSFCTLRMTCCAVNASPFPCLMKYCTVTDRTKPSLLALTVRTMPNLYFHLMRPESAIMARSPTLIFLELRCHF